MRISVLLILLLTVVVAEKVVMANNNKDTNYWSNGRSNPNERKFDMYWRDAKGVLLDLQEFDKLYIKFHNCVWSEYGLEGKDGYYQGCGNDENENNYDDDNNDEGQSAYWYMGATQCFRANAAFTLYGVLAGNKDLGCRKATYINSFFTRLGVTEYMDAVSDYSGYEWQTQYEVYDGDDNNNRKRQRGRRLVKDDNKRRRQLDQEEDDYQYEYYGNEEEEEEEAVDGQEEDQNEKDGDDQGDDNDDDAIVVSSYCYHNDGREGNDDLNENNYYYDAVMGGRLFPYATSYTLGCLNNNYVYASFNGAYCDGSWAKQVEDKLSEFNKEINQLGCTEIYSSNNGNNNNNNRNNDDDEDYDEGEIMMNEAVYDLLYNSAPCSLRQYPHRCPDPYGLLKRYAKAIERSTRSISYTTSEKSLDNFILWMTWLLGIGFMLASFYITGKAAKDVEKQQANVIIAQVAADAKAGISLGENDDVDDVKKKGDITSKGSIRDVSSLVRRSSSLIAKGVVETASTISEMATNAKEKVQEYAEATVAVATPDEVTDEVKDAEEYTCIDASDARNTEDTKDVVTGTSSRSFVSKLMGCSSSIAEPKGTTAAANAKSETDYVLAPDDSSSSIDSAQESTSNVNDDDDEPVLVPMVPEANAAEKPEMETVGVCVGVYPVNKVQDDGETNTSTSHDGGGRRGDNSGRSFRSLWSNKSGRSIATKSVKSGKSIKSSGSQRYIRPRLAKASKALFGKKNRQQRNTTADLLAPDSMEFGENNMASF